MSSSSFSKRQKERTRQERQREKLAKRQQKGPSDERPKTDASGAPIDPDIADIVPGPQPPIEG